MPRGRPPEEARLIKLLLVGASGTLGSAVGAALAAGREVIELSRSGRYTVDLADQTSIGALLDEVGSVEGAQTGQVYRVGH